MRRPLHLAALALAGLTAVASPAIADPLSELRNLDAQLSRLVADRLDWDKKLTSLALESASEAKAVADLKSQPPGPVRDLKLQRALSEAHETASHLERLQSSLRTFDANVRVLRKSIIDEIDRILAHPQQDSSVVFVNRADLTRRRDLEASLLETPARDLEIARPVADALDGPAELTEKADLLKDSEDKLRREIDRLGKRIDGVEGRRRLRERASAVDDDLFLEAGSGRRIVRTSPTTNEKARGGANEIGIFGSPAPQQSPGGNFADASGAGTSNSTYGQSLRGSLDPSTLDELRRAEAGQDLDRQLRALRKMQTGLRGLADDLGKREADLRRRAGEIKPRKGR